MVQLKAMSNEMALGKSILAEQALRTLQLSCR